ncbi:NAD(P)/FAD-dependent oxidoreductase, partial [Candidatus Bipolaricaulota bacterium]|nr:NAD(P)/FAD-dependent oxidoreductase [Candidatus Bipolaricaulota bacterium]
LARGRFDVVVVGGGPAGTLAAAAAAEAGAKVLLLERTTKAPPRCTGLVSPQAVELLSIPPSLIREKIRAARVHSPGGQILELSSRKTKGYVIDRAGLDHLLLARAGEAGVEVRVGVAATGYAEGLVYTTCGKVGCEVLIGADGPVSSVARWAGLSRPRELLVGLQAIVRAKVPGEKVEVFLGRQVAPGFFAWAVPAGEGEVRVGLATQHGKVAGELLERLLATRFPKAEVVAKVAGLIPIGPPPRTAAGRVLLVGDAAGQVKPTSGGGLYFGAVCAQLAGRLAAQGPSALKGYEKAWRDEIGEELSFGLRARHVLKHLSDEEIDRVFSALNDGKLLGFIAQAADIDHPSALVQKVLGKPALWGRLVPVVNAMGGWGRVRRLLYGLPQSDSPS